MGSCELFTELALNNNPDLCSTEQVGLQESATALLVIFQTGLRLSAWMVSDLNPPASASHITGITGINHHAQLVTTSFTYIIYL
jgi:hypothetical protein